MQQKLVIGAVVIIFLAVIGFGYISFRNRSAPTAQAPMPSTTSSSPVASATTSASLGTQIYQQSQNPIQNKVPNAQNPSVNPIEGAYKNPFD